MTKKMGLQSGPLSLTICLLAALLGGCGGSFGGGSDGSSATQVLETGAGPGSAEPHLAVGPDGTTILSFLEPVADGTALRYSVLQNVEWSAPKTLISGADWFVNWADFPSVEPLTANRWAAHWLVKSAGETYAYDAVVAVSEDAGSSWAKPQLLHTDGTATEHGFVSLFPVTDGVGAVWLDGRQTADRTGGMQLRAVQVKAGLLVDNAVVDALVCDCCQTDAVLLESGPVVIYRNRSENEIRDVYVARQVNEVWQAGVEVAADGWRITGCPVNGPAIAAKNNTVVVAWFTNAETQLESGQTANRVQLARSIDGGESFAPPVLIDALDPIGRVDVVLLDNGLAVVSWIERGAGELKLQRIAANGQKEPPQVVTSIQTSRSSGFPQMVITPAGLLFAWTDTSKEQTQVRSLLLN